MNSYTITRSVTLVVRECSECSIVHAIPSDMNERALADRSKSWYCPNGHSQVYKDTEVMRLQEELKRKAREVEAANSARDTWMKSAQKYKGELEVSEKSTARLKRRVANGVCSCCHRTFKQLSVHMKRQHPEYVEESKLKVGA